MAKIKINNVEYGWSQVRFSAGTDLGIEENSPILAGVTAVNWNKKRIVEPVYGVGHRPIGRGIGNTEMEASITFLTSVQIALRGQLNTLMELGEFDLIVSFESEFESEDAVIGNNTVILKGCLFNEDGFEAKQGDTSAEKTFELNVLDIVYQDNQL